MNVAGEHVIRGEGTEAVVSGRVSVIVPTRNSARTLEACLASVRAQSYGDIELIVVDNHSTDATLEIARRQADRVLAAGPERSAQRNAGARASSGEFLLFVDSDMVLEPAVAEEVFRAFRAQPDIEALVIPERSVGVGFWARCRALEKELYLGDPDVEAARAFRRAAFDAAGGYDEGIHGGGEDWDLPERVIGAGGAIDRVEAGVLHDEGRLTLRAVLAKKLYYGRTLARYIRKHPGRAVRKIARRAFLCRVNLLAREPAHALGLLTLKGLELVAVTLGMAAGRVQPSQGPAQAGGPQAMNGAGREEDKPTLTSLRLRCLRVLARDDAAIFGRLRWSVGVVTRIRGDRVLDVGCASGWLREAVNDRSYVGVDLTARISGGKRGWQFVQADGRQLPFANESFDLVILFEVIEHLPPGSERQALAEALRVLRPGGKVLLSTPHRHFLGTVLDPAWWMRGHRHYTETEVVSFLKHVGFGEVHVEVRGRIAEAIYLPVFYLFKRLRLSVPWERRWRRAIDREYERQGWYTIMTVATRPSDPVVCR